MYIFNKEAKLFWKDKNVHAFTAPVELNEKELMDLGLEELELMVYGYLPLMVTAQCLYTSTNACNKCKAASNKIDYILDRMGKRFYVKASCVVVAIIYMDSDFPCWVRQTRLET